jgi:group I intron endonuclease
MNIILNNNCSLDKPGIYKIMNTKNGKFYIGSTTMRVYKRLQHHYEMLKVGKHKNQHLQNAWNLYGIDAFQFIVEENLEKSDCLKREQELIDQEGIENLYNINPLASGTPNMSKETILKRAKTMKRKYQSGEMVSSFYKGHTPWNKGKKQGDIDYSYLKGVKKTKTEKLIESRKKIQEDMKNRTSVYVYDSSNNFLGFWKNAHLLEKESENDNFLLIPHMILKNKIGRNGYKPHVLKVFNIQKSINHNVPYKGLNFNNKPLHEEIRVEKLDKNGELCDENTVLNKETNKSLSV